MLTVQPVAIVSRVTELIFLCPMMVSPRTFIGYTVVKMPTVLYDTLISTRWSDRLTCWSSLRFVASLMNSSSSSSSPSPPPAPFFFDPASSSSSSPSTCNARHDTVAQKQEGTDKQNRNVPIRVRRLTGLHADKHCSRRRFCCGSRVTWILFSRPYPHRHERRNFVLLARGVGGRGRGGYRCC